LKENKIALNPIMSSYHEIEINGKAFPMLFGLRSMKIASATVIDREFLDTETFLINTSKSVLMAGHLAWAVENSKKPQFTPKEILNYLESLQTEDEWKQVTDALHAFSETKRVEMNGSATEDEKKSLNQL
jgi:hypothetical protein